MTGKNTTKDKKAQTPKIDKSSIVAPDAVDPEKRVTDLEKEKRGGRYPRHDEPIGGS